ncbi:glucuronate isomerase [bacterium E08(2017)]|nr:glucuronate isomerase [bacterium E08(2017)]
MNFMNENFMLQTEAARRLYFEYAQQMPTIDYHSHLPPHEIADDINFENIGSVWLGGDHYKWRAMRSNGVDEKYCTGDASDWEKFEKWAETVPSCLRNPLYHWTHLELQRYFGIDKLLDNSTAKEIYDECSAKLQTPEYSVRGLIKMMNVEVICTTDDPIHSLKHHAKIKEDNADVKVYPTFRPDDCMAGENTEVYNGYLDTLSEVAGIDIKDYDSLLEAVKARHDFFHASGCRMSDHGITTAYAEDYTESEVKAIFAKVRSGKDLDKAEDLKLKSALMVEFGKMDYERDWVMQVHIGALRSNNTRAFEALGRDTGFDSITDEPMAANLARFMDRLEQTSQLPKTILYNLNPCDNALMGTMIGNFQDGSVPGKIQYGSGWWFLDQKFGMQDQINTLSVLGLLSRFVGMLTDSRSFLSFPRHEYFRRILCNLLGTDMENGEIPGDFDLVGGMVKDICYNNAINYFDFAE